LPVPQRIATQCARRRTTMGGATTFQRNDTNGNNSMIPPASLCSATARADAADEDVEREGSNEITTEAYENFSQATEALSLSGFAPSGHAMVCKVSSCAAVRLWAERLRSAVMIRF
ncbi:MAG TPA: hypothetical protein DCO86_01535, partial [Spirochaetaceae bacterium]|nr:hypothetical protein [Spirochaetaceae bacterium]